MILIPYITTVITGGIVAGTTTYLFSQSLGNSIIVAIFATIATALLLLCLTVITSWAENKQYERELLAFSKEAERQGWELKELLHLKNNVRSYLLKHPGTSTEELIKRYGDKTKPYLDEPEFTRTLTHLGYYSINRFGQDETGKWFSIHDNKTVSRKYKHYQNYILKSYNEKEFINA